MSGVGDGVGSGGGSLDGWSTRGIVATMMPLLVALSVLEMGSGFVLQELEATFLGRPTLLVLVPVMIAMGGNLGSILSSRLSTRLHLGTLEFSVRNPVILKNVVAVLALAATVFTLLGVAAWVVGRTPLVAGGGTTLGETLFVSLASGMTLAVVVAALSVSATYASYRMGLDPDDTTIPVVTNLCDILGIVILSAVSLWAL